MICKFQKECGNLNISCFKCFDYSLYKPLKTIKALSSKSKHVKSKKQGMDFEKKGVHAYNQASQKGRDVARQQLASGALSFALGDMITEEEMIASIAEFKERGQLSSTGQKQITLKKEWFDKLAEEARYMKKDHYFLPFSFKGEPSIYVALEYNILLSYIQHIHFLQEILQKKEK
jgi:hypothetical protein